MKTKDKKIKTITIISISIILICLILVLVLAYLNKTRIFKEVVSNLDTSLISGIDNKNIDFLNINEPTRFNLTFNDHNNPEETINVKIDADNTKNTLGINANYNSLYDIGLYQTKNGIYLKSDTLLDKIYNLDLTLDSGCQENCETSLDSYVNNLTSNFTFNPEQLKETLNSLRDTINKSLKPKYVSINNKESITINDTTINGKKHSYKLNKDSLEVLIDNIDNNKELKNKLFNLFANYFDKNNITKDNFKDIISKISQEGSFDIYEVNGDIKLIKINYDEFAYLEIIPNGNTVNINVGGDFIGLDFKISADKENQVYNVSIYNLKKLIYDINFSKKDIFELNIKYHYNDKVYPISITNNSSKDGNITKGIVTFKYNDYVYDINYTIEKNITLDNYDFTNSSSINDLTNIDTSKLESAIEVIRESNLIKSLLNLYQELS